MVKTSEITWPEEISEAAELDSLPRTKQRNIGPRLSNLSLGKSREDFLPLFRKGEKVLHDWTPTQKPEGVAQYQVVDFFSGCGGMSLGFSALGLATETVEVVGGCDIDPAAARSFEENIGAPCVVADISEISMSKVQIRKLLENYPRYNPNRQTILIGCAPCQGFSSHRKKSWNEPDPRNSLPARFALIAKEINPACIVMENVPEMLSVKYWEKFAAVKNILEGAGYIVKQSIYNAAEFGVPQERFRAVVIAMKRDFLLPMPVIVDHSEFRTVRHAIGSLPVLAAGERTDLDPLHYSASHKRSTITTIMAVPRDGGGRPIGIGPACLDRIKGFSDVYGRLFWDRPAITITHYARNPASGRFVHPEQHRGLTMRECAQLQSFPKGFLFTGPSDAIYKQIGESVPPLLSLGIAAHLLIELESEAPNADQLQSGVPSIESPISSSYSSVIAGIKTGRKKK
jgi:DNA (cytosine-5)-methyltransferase 1